MKARAPAIAVLTAVLAAAGAARAQPAHLAPGEVPSGAIEPEPPVVELLTFGIGARIFEKFGHAAICLRYLRILSPMTRASSRSLSGRMTANSSPP